MTHHLAAFVVGLLIAAPAQAQGAVADASATLRPPAVTAADQGRRVVQEVALATSVAGYDLRYDVIELEDEPGRVAFHMWAPTIGYTPLGIAGPSMENWYNQGFFIWTFDGFNIQDCQATFRVVRGHGQDAMVEYVWDTPKVKAVARFAVTSQSDKLLFFGRYEAKEPISEVKLRLMAYPATFDKPWVRTLTTATRTLSEGAAEIDLARERWLLLEDIHPGRQGAGSAGLLLGDAEAFSKVTVNGIGGYAEYVDIVLEPSRRDFALGLYEYPAIPGCEETRAYFRRLADAESDALAQLARADLDQPLAPLPVDDERIAAIARMDEQSLERPAERWRANPAPLDFDWAARLPGPPLHVAILAPRWAAYDTMELARRLEMDVQHQYFDTNTAITNPGTWPYRNQTGIGPLNTGVATRNAVRICVDASTDVIVVGALAGGALGPRLQAAILDQVEQGKGLVLTGDAGVLAGWPKELTANPDEGLAGPALEGLPWDRVPGLRDGGRGRIGGDAPLKGYRYGQGRVLVFTANLGRYHALLPLNDATEGLAGADDRILALHAMALLAAAGRPMPARIAFGELEGNAAALPVSVTGGEWDRALVRIEDDLDTVVASGADLLDAAASVVRLPALPAMRRHYVDVVLENEAGECVGLGSTVLDVTPVHTIETVALSPSTLVHEAAVPMVDLAGGGTLTCTGAIAPPPGGGALSVLWEVGDCLGRLLAGGTSPVQADGTAGAPLELLRPVTIAHHLDVTLLSGDTPLAVRRVPFTIPIPFPYDDFTILMWSYARGELPVRLENRACYEMGSDMMDLCHMRGYSDAAAAREYAVAARSGQRIVPYVTRVAGTSREDHSLDPGLFNEAWIEGERASMAICCRQAAPYHPPAYTLGDENYLARGAHEVEVSPESTQAFRRWLAERYGDVEALNAAWLTDYDDFDAIERPMLLDEAAQQTGSFAPWFDFRDFMDTAFARLHERLAGFVRNEDPGAKVGWDGLLSYHWLAGYDFYKMTRDLELNQVYTSQRLQTELVRSFKRPDALAGEWGNAIADKEDGFSAIAWHNLFKGHNSCWWWTSWGCDYIPFNPDLSVSHMGRWFFEQAQEIKSGPGKLLLHATRDHSGIAVLYSQADLFASKLADKMAEGAAWPGALNWQSDLAGLMCAIEDLGRQYQFVAAAEIEGNPDRLHDFEVLILPYAVCLSDKQVEAVRDFVGAGGLVIADGRTALLTANGAIRGERPLDEVFGVRGTAGRDAFVQTPKPITLDIDGEGFETHALEPRLEPTTGQAKYTADGVPVLVVNAYGQGHAVLLNLPFAAVNRLRGQGTERLLLDAFAEFLALAGVGPHARLVTAEGPARCIEQALFVDGPLRYLGLEQDILLRGLDEQRATLEIDEPAFVYDVRAGRQVGAERIAAWEVALSRGRPQLFALLPYRVTSLEAEASEQARLGEAVPLRVAVGVEPGEPAYHVVHVDVFAPGSEKPHREYSQNIDCPGGEGEATIPLALNDPEGPWRLEFKDAATGTRTESEVRVSGRPAGA